MNIGSIAQAAVGAKDPGGKIGQYAGLKQADSGTGGAGGSSTYSDPGAWQAYQDALANIKHQRELYAQQYGFNTDGSVDSTNKYGLWQQAKHSYDTGVSRANQDYQTGITRSNQDSGLTAQFDAKGNPIGLGLQVNNPHGEFEQMLASQADELRAANEDSAARHIGGPGLGAQAASRASFQQAGDRQSYRRQLVNQLMDSHTSNQRTLDDLGFQWGSDQQNLLTQFKQGLLGFDQQGSQALQGYNSTMSQGAYNDIMNKILNGQFPTAGSGGGGSSGGNKSALTMGQLITKYIK